MIEWSKTIYDKIRLPFLKCAIKLNLTSIKISIINHVLTLTIGCYLFSRGTYLCYIGALLVCVVNGFLDYLDGDLARSKNEMSEAGAWLDSGFDVIIQNAVLGSIAIGCYKQELPLIWIIMFFIGNTSCNFVSFNYNQKFGFDSCRGNQVFRQYMDKSRSRFDRFFRDLIDPTSNPFALFIYTYRYFIAFGCVFNIMPVCFMIMTTITNIRWFIMYVIYALYLNGNKKMHVLTALSLLDEERSEFYAIRSGRKI